MKMFARAAYLPAMLIVAICLSVSACGQGGKGKRNPTPEEPEGRFAGKEMAMKQAAITFNITMEELLLALEHDQIPDYVGVSANEYTYDALGRFAREIIKTYPQSDFSNIPVRGTVAYDMQFTYSSSEPWKEESAVQQIWDSWWDGGSLAPQRTTTWIDHVEDVTYYNTETPGLISSTATFEIIEVLNDQGYLTRSTRQNIMTQEIQSEEIFYRAIDGIQLDRIENAGETVEYRYYPNGALESMEVRSNSGARDVTTYEYLTDEVYSIIAETRSYGADGTDLGVRTALEIFAIGFCHEATRQRVTFERPKWAVCRELSNWR